MKGTAMNEAPLEQDPGTEVVKDEIRDEHGDAAIAPSATPQEDDEQVSPEEFEEDPARNPDDGALKNIKGA
jgi:hypothetical protein